MEIEDLWKDQSSVADFVIYAFYFSMKQQPLSTEGCEAVNYSLLLLRNILHAPERPPMQEPIIEESTDPPSPGNNANNNNDASNGERRGSRPSNEAHTPYLGPHVHSHGYSSDCSQQNRLLWNLFAQGLDRLLINMLSSPHKVNFTLTLNDIKQEFLVCGWLFRRKSMGRRWLGFGGHWSTCAAFFSCCTCRLREIGRWRSGAVYRSVVTDPQNCVDGRIFFGPGIRQLGWFVWKRCPAGG